jgi:hypothetical protein
MISKTDTIVCAYAERAAGPGWANSPLWVIVRNEDGKLRQEVLQPDEQSREVVALYSISEAVHHAMLYALRERKRS